MSVSVRIFVTFLTIGLIIASIGVGLGAQIDNQQELDETVETFNTGLTADAAAEHDPQTGGPDVIIENAERFEEAVADVNPFHQQFEAFRMAVLETVMGSARWVVVGSIMIGYRLSTMLPASLVTYAAQGGALAGLIGLVGYKLWRLKWLFSEVSG